MKKKKNSDKEVDEENDKKVTRRTLRLEARVTEQEYAQAKELAKTCGLSMSDYVRRPDFDNDSPYSFTLMSKASSSGLIASC